MRTKAIMAANSYKKMYGDKETCSNICINELTDLRCPTRNMLSAVLPSHLG